ncbi:MAG: 6,7-dimethyl-8-ribityllumazine synthase [Dehalococcoidia bacterium]|nr:6,7-dimethyl-8-ribityllumazine synthase [Dehalococcoidia bacterium]
MARTFEGEADGKDLTIAVVVSRFNKEITDRLLEGARDALSRQGMAERADIAYVPGSFELPLAALRLARTGRYDAVVCLGAVLRGETAHFEYVAGQAAAGIARVSLDTGLPVIFGVVTAETLEQALERSGGRLGNKGYDAVLAAIEMANLLKKIDSGAQGKQRGSQRKGR